MGSSLISVDSVFDQLLMLSDLDNPTKLSEIFCMLIMIYSLFPMHLSLDGTTKELLIIKLGDRLRKGFSLPY